MPNPTSRSGTRSNVPCGTARQWRSPSPIERTSLPSYPRHELETMWQAWIEVNKHAQDIGDWRPLAEYYAEDATYGWMYQPDEHFMAVGRDQIRDWALGFEMLGFDGWSYPYVSAVL